jgi:hypothetical protein
MGARGSFDIPSGPRPSTAGAKRAYRQRFGHDFTGSDNAIRQVASTACCCAGVLEAMRDISAPSPREPNP